MIPPHQRTSCLSPKVQIITTPVNQMQDFNDTIAYTGTFNAPNRGTFTCFQYLFVAIIFRINCNCLHAALVQAGWWLSSFIEIKEIQFRGPAFIFNFSKAMAVFNLGHQSREFGLVILSHCLHLRKTAGSWSICRLILMNSLSSQHEIHNSSLYYAFYQCCWSSVHGTSS